MFEAEGPSTDIKDGMSYRTDLVCNTNTDYVYLIMCRLLVSVAACRQAIMDYAGISDTNGNTSNPYWRVILLDGGRSAQFVGPTLTTGAPLARKVVQIVGIPK